jgi:hypothetical protein
VAEGRAQPAEARSAAAAREIRFRMGKS